MVHDLATQWIQSYPCEKSQETARILLKFLDPEDNPQVIYTDMTIHWNLEKLVKIFNGTIVRLHIIGLRRMVLKRER